MTPEATPNWPALPTLANYYFREDKLDDYSYALSDVLCWLDGFIAAGGKYSPGSVETLRDLNCAVKSVREKMPCGESYSHPIKKTKNKMSNELATTTPNAVAMPERKLSVLMSLATRYNVEPAKLLDTLKQTVFKNSTEAQLMALCIVADQYQLNPFTKQIYAFPDKGGGIVPVIGVDGWMKMMNEHPQFDGVEIEVTEDQTTGKPYSCTATIHVKTGNSQRR